MSKKSLLAVLAILCGLGLMLSLSAPAYGQAKAKDTIILKGAPMGGVKFEHKLHTERAENKCEVCHHASKPEKASTQPQEACTACHTKAATPPMKTNTVGAFHKTATATAGTCIDCHKTENAKGKKAPVKCMDCHKKENT
jgi:nitrate/TMAO reductase-like tetraheme cytochrome c subunit